MQSSAREQSSNTIRIEASSAIQSSKARSVFNVLRLPAADSEALRSVSLGFGHTQLYINGQVSVRIITFGLGVLDKGCEDICEVSYLRVSQ